MWVDISDETFPQTHLIAIHFWTLQFFQVTCCNNILSNKLSHTVLL